MARQLGFDWVPPPTSLPAPSQDLRLVNYLGSKLRLLDPIIAAVKEVTPDGASVCDLFAGSGVVSLALSRNWCVTAVDIQEYSRVLCNAVLNPLPAPDETEGMLVTSARNGVLREGLRASVCGLVDHERWCLQQAAIGSMDNLADLLEVGSLRSFGAHGSEAPSRLHRLLNESVGRLRGRDLDTGPETVVTRHFGGVYFSWEQAVDLDALLRQSGLVKTSSVGRFGT